jgi:glutathione S-transferase
LIEKYDDNEKISFKSGANKYLTQQWLAFQISGTNYRSYILDAANSALGQGPYFGQATWFARFHLEKIPSAIDRYVNEIIRVTGVIDAGLRSNGTGWLVGDKMTYADLSFVTWAWIGDGLMKELGKPALGSSFPEYGKWMQRMEEGEAVKSIKDRISRARVDHGLN